MLRKLGLLHHAVANATEGIVSQAKGGMHVVSPGEDPLGAVGTLLVLRAGLA